MARPLSIQIAIESEECRIQGQVVSFSFDDENVVPEFILSLLSEDGENISDNDSDEYDTDHPAPKCSK